MPDNDLFTTEPQAMDIFPAKNQLSIASKSLTDKQQRRINQFSRSNPKLRAALDKRQADDALHARADIQEVSQFLLNKVIAAATENPEELTGEKATNALRFMRSEEMHQAKIDKIKADTEAVLINVATPTAIRQIVNDFGMTIKTGTEEIAFDALALAETEGERDKIKQICGDIYGRIMQKIQQMGYEDTSLARLIAAPH
ncbi:MAG: hypothetical protein ACRYFS_24405 [Janthinobacterium lividum]